MIKNILSLFFTCFFTISMLPILFAQDKKIEFPYLIECENAINKPTCSRETFYNYIVQQIKDSNISIENEVNESVIVQFIITATGKITNIHLIKNRSKKTAEEIILLLKKIEKNSLKWQYGTINGIPKDFIVSSYSIYFNQKTPELTFVPPHFNMIAKEKVRVIKIKKRRKKTDIPPKKTISSFPKPKSTPAKTPPKDNSIIYLEVDRAPIFPGCQNGGPFRDSLKANDCSLMALNNYVAKLLKYPSQAYIYGIEGIVVVEYVVEKDGTLSNIKYLKDIGGGCGDAAVELFEQMNIYNIRWKPAQFQRKKVRVKKQYLVRFDLSQEKARRSQGNN